MTITNLPEVHLTQVQNQVMDWKDQGLPIRVLTGDSIHLPHSADFQAVARMGWSRENLLLHVEVTDPTPYEADKTNRLYEGDSVELCLMTGDNDKAGMIQLVASPGRGKDQAAPRYMVFDYRDKEFKKAATAFIPCIAVTKTLRGYSMDMMLPWASMNIHPAAGTLIKAGFKVNNATSQDVKDVIHATWINHLPQSGWMKLPVLRLAEKPSAAAVLTAWTGYDNFKIGYVNVMAELELKDRKITVSEAGRVLAKGTLVPDGERVVASLQFSPPPFGQKHGPLTLAMDGADILTLTPPDIDQQRRNLFLSGEGNPWSHEKNPPWAQVTCKPEVFTGDKLPTCNFSEPARMRELVGAYTVRTTYYDADFNPVEKASKAGRYGAVTAFTSPTGDKFTAYKTLYRTPAEKIQNPDKAAYLEAAAANPAVQKDEFLAAKTDSDWWHTLRKKRGDETKYEYYVHLPKNYGQDKNKRWPVLFYLHGSGGGVKIEDVQNGAIQKPARDWADFPFIAVSLRSPGGWHPPAVKDVIDEVTAKYQTDTSRYYLTGFSMGGMGTWAVTLDQPDRFAAIAVVGGRDGNPSQAARIKHVAAWVINGESDHSTTSDDALKMVEALKKAGAEVKWTEIPQADHVSSHNTAYAWPELYKWLLEHHK